MFPSPGRIKVVVGSGYEVKGAVAFYLPQNLLTTQSKLFAARFPEGEASECLTVKALHLHDTGKEVFALFALWLVANDKTEHESLVNIIRTELDYQDLWQAAEKLDSDGFKNWLVDVVLVLFGKDAISTFSTLQTFEFHDISGTAPGNRLTEEMAAMIVRDGGWERWIKATWPARDHPNGHYDSTTRFRNFAGDYPAVLINLLLKVEMYQSLKEAGELIDPRNEICSKWHIHATAEGRENCTSYP